MEFSFRNSFEGVKKKNQPFDKIRKGKLMEGKLYCEVRSSLLMLLMLFGSGLFCFVFEKKKNTSSRKRRKRNIFCFRSTQNFNSVPESPKAAPGERRMYQKMSWETPK